jgi:hypothetical protein
MVEHLLSGTLQVQPGPDGHRRVGIITGPADIYLLTLDESEAHALAELLTLSPEELQTQTERARAAERLVIPGTNGHSPNGR